MIYIFKITPYVIKKGYTVLFFQKSMTKKVVFYLIKKESVIKNNSYV